MAKKVVRKGLDNRGQDRSGQIRRKRGDTLVRTIRREYGEHVLPQFRATTRLDKALAKTGATSLHQLLKLK